MSTSRSSTAQEGIRMLKQGCSASKYGRSGKPHVVAFRLSEDERTLSWKGTGMRESLGVKDERRAALSSVAHLLVGRESAVFKRFQDDRQKAGRLSRSNYFEETEERQLSPSAGKRGAGKLHLSLSLQFGRNDERDTLDVSFDDGALRLQAASDPFVPLALSLRLAPSRLVALARSQRSSSDCGSPHCACSSQTTHWGQT